MNGGEACRKGSPAITVLRVDPRRWRMDVFHQSESPGDPVRADIESWQRRTGATVIFNAGQYYPDHLPMGLFVKRGKNLGTARVRRWKGLLVAEPTDAKQYRPADILDLEHDAFDVRTTPYRIAVQSFMILDRDHKKRVRRSDWHANRTVVATDGSGHLLVVHTEGAYTLWDLADWLDRSDLDVRLAMSMDGGFEAQICVHTEELAFASFGQWHVDSHGDHSIAGLRRPLPAVIGLFPR
ncbi:MAG: phosphodiester glycosidase family protein [Acidobacteriota bacterium]